MSGQIDVHSSQALLPGVLPPLRSLFITYNLLIQIHYLSHNAGLIFHFGCKLSCRIYIPDMCIYNYRVSTFRLIISQCTHTGVSSTLLMSPARGRNMCMSGARSKPWVNHFTLGAPLSKCLGLVLIILNNFKRSLCTHVLHIDLT